jgi:hypothetical protein
MHRMLTIPAAGMIMTALAVGAAGCSGASVPRAAPATTHVQATVHAPASNRRVAATQAPAGVAEVWVQVLRRYLSTPGENSFPQAFKTVYVFDLAYPDAADPNGKHAGGTLIARQEQRQITAALKGMAHVTFIADRASVIQPTHGCWQVRNGGILITLGTPVMHGPEMRVGINGGVACAGATWLTYVLRNQPGGSWRVTGTTNTMAIA